MCKKFISLCVLAVLVVNMLWPVASEAEELKRWILEYERQAPAVYAAHNINQYVRGEYADFWINYNGDDLGTDGAVHVGHLLPVDVFDRVEGEQRWGYAAVSDDNLRKPYSGNPTEVKAFLEGFQFLKDGEYYPISLNYLEDYAAEDFSNFDPWPISKAAGGAVIPPEKIIVQDIPGEQVRAWEYSPALGAGEIDCIQNSGQPGFIGESYYVKQPGDGSTPNLWQKARVYIDDPRGPVNLTEYQAVYYMNHKISHGTGDGQSMAPDYPTRYYPAKSWRVDSVVSFPYNVLVTEVKKIYDNGDTADYDWFVVNQTPLWLTGITVRVYTRGKTTGTWNLVQIYQNIDIPPAKRGGGLLCDPQSKDVIVKATGRWSVAQPKVYTRVPKPAEDYDVIVTANVNLNIQSGQASFPSATVDYGMRGAYAAGSKGKAPPGLPPGETKEMWNKASSILGVSLPRGYNDNVASTSDKGIPLPPGRDEGEPNNKPSNLAVTKLELFDQYGNPISGVVEINKPYKMKATFNSSFDFSGWTKVRFYVKRQAGWMELKKEEDAYFEPGGSVQKTWDWTGMSENVTLVATVAYRWWDQQSKWVEEPFVGRTETTYDDNKRELSVSGTDIEKRPPEPGYWQYPLYYHPIKPKAIPVYEDYTEPIYGWKKVPFIKEEPNVKKRVRLTE